MTDYLQKYKVCEALDRLNKRYPNGRWPENDLDYARIRLFRSAVALSDQKRKLTQDPKSIIQKCVDEGYTMTQIALELGVSVEKLRYLMKKYRTLTDQFNYYQERSK
jgi:DNA-binding NarL/FixJ family response regulator